MAPVAQIVTATPSGWHSNPNPSPLGVSPQSPSRDSTLLDEGRSVDRERLGRGLLPTGPTAETRFELRATAQEARDHGTTPCATRPAAARPLPVIDEVRR
jgi:hypothetical protein